MKQIFMKSLKKWLQRGALCLGLLPLGNFYTNAQQNNVWTLAPNHFYNESSDYAILPTPPPTLPGLNDELFYDGENAKNCHNVMQDTEGNLLFFMVDNKVYDKDGYLINYVNYNAFQVSGTAEIMIVPDPGNCERYYIFAAGSDDFGAIDNTGGRRPFYAILDFTLENVNFPGKNGALVENGGFGTAFSIIDMTPGMYSPFLKDGTAFFSATQLRSDNSRLIFVGNHESLYRYRLTSSGLVYEGYSFYYTGATLNGLNNLSQRGEMELINLPSGNYRIATPFRMTTSTGVSSRTVFTAELDPNGNVIPSTVNIIEYFLAPFENDLNTPYVYGLEFSPNGNILYITHRANSTYTNPIEYYDFSNPSLGVQPLLVTNAIDFQHSQIETGKDGLMYFATSNRLATLSDPNNPNPSNWNNSAVSITYSENYIGSLTSDNISTKTYILPDQIDGMDYTDHFLLIHFVV